MAKLGKYLSLCLVGILVSSILIMVGPTYVEARTIVVPTEYTSIQQAIDSASTGDTVLVKKGYYNETLIVNKTLSLIGEDRDFTIIDAQKSHSPAIRIQGDNIVVANLTLGNTGYGPATSKYWSPSPGEGTGITVFPVSNYVTITNNRILNCPYTGIFLYFSKFNAITNNLIGQSRFGVAVECIDSNIANNIFATSQSIDFPTYQVATNEGRWIVNESNTIEENQMINPADISSPFPSTTPNPSPSIPEFPMTILSVTILAAASLLLVISKRKLSYNH